MTLARDLLDAEWTARRRAYVMLFLLFAGTSASFLLALGLLGGLEDRIGGELSENLAGDVRVTLQSDALADGLLIPGERDVRARLEAVDPQALVVGRLEAEGLFLKGAGFTTSRPDGPGVTRSAGILVGVDAERERGAFGPDSFLQEGIALRDASGDLRDPTGERLVPIVVGVEFARTNDVTVAGDAFAWSSVLNVTTGKTENGQLVGVRCIVVGAYETGFKMIDRGVVYMPRGEVARLMGHHPDDPPANALLVRTSDEEAVTAAVERAGLDATSGREFRGSYFGPVFRAVRVVTWGILAALTAAMAAWFAHTLAHHVREDRRKIATLRAIGIPARDLSRTYATLAATLGFGGALLGTLAAALLFPILGLLATRALPGTPFVPRVGVLEALALVALLGGTGVVAAVVALGRAFRGSVQEGLRAG